MLCLGLRSNQRRRTDGGSGRTSATHEPIVHDRAKRTTDTQYRPAPIHAMQHKPQIHRSPKRLQRQLQGKLLTVQSFHTTPPASLYTRVNCLWLHRDALRHYFPRSIFSKSNSLYTAEAANLSNDLNKIFPTIPGIGVMSTIVFEKIELEKRVPAGVISKDLATGLHNKTSPASQCHGLCKSNQ